MFGVMSLLVEGDGRVDLITSIRHSGTFSPSQAPRHEVILVQESTNCILSCGLWPNSDRGRSEGCDVGGGSGSG